MYETMIDPNSISTVSIDQLPDGDLNLATLFPHSEIGGVMKKANLQALANLISTYIGSTEAVGLLPISVTNGQQLPDVPLLPSFFLCGAGTYLNINGYPNLTCTGQLNAIMSLSDHWAIAVEIPIVYNSGVQTVTGSAVDNTDPLNPVINAIGKRTIRRVNSGDYTFINSDKDKHIYVDLVANVILEAGVFSLGDVLVYDYGWIEPDNPDDNLPLIYDSEFIKVNNCDYGNPNRFVYINQTATLTLSKIESGVEYWDFRVIGDSVGGGTGTNLGYTQSPTDGKVTSDTGTDATLTLADDTNAGLLKPADFTQLSTLATDLGNKANKNGSTSEDFQVPTTPSGANSAVSKNYIDNAITGINWKQAVKCSTTANQTLSGTSNVDGVTIPAGTRVLVRFQTTASENGIYISASGAWSRATDCDTASEVEASTVLVQSGTLYKQTQWTQSNPITTLGTDPVSYVQVSGAGTYTASTGLSLTANVFSIIASSFGAFITSLSAKNTLVDADTVVSGDSAASGDAKKTTWLNVWDNYIKPKVNALFLSLGGGTLTGTLNGTSSVMSGDSQVGSSGKFIFGGNSYFISSSSGVISFYTSAGGNPNRIVAGPADGTSPAWQRNSAAWQAVTGNNGAYVGVQSLYQRYGSGTPESVVTAPIGAIYHRTDGGAGTSFYVKESGTGNTGWVAK